MDLSVAHRYSSMVPLALDKLICSDRSQYQNSCVNDKCFGVCKDVFHGVPLSLKVLFVISVVAASGVYTF